MLITPSPTYSEKAWIEKDISTYSPKLTFTTDLYRETGKTRLAKKVLRHADISTTMIYPHIVARGLKGRLSCLGSVE